MKDFDGLVSRRGILKGIAGAIAGLGAGAALQASGGEVLWTPAPARIVTLDPHEGLRFSVERAGGQKLLDFAIGQQAHMRWVAAPGEGCYIHDGHQLLETFAGGVVMDNRGGLWSFLGSSGGRREGAKLR